MADVTAHDMGRYWRLVTVDGGLVTGAFWVALPLPAHRNQSVHVKTVDVIVWADERHTSGCCLDSADLTAFVDDGEVRIPEHMISKQIRWDVLDAMDAMKIAIRLAAEAAVRPEAAR